MATNLTFDGPAPAAAAPAPRARIADDMALLKAAAELTRELSAPDPRVYWADFLASVLIGYAALVATILSGGWAAFGFGSVAVLALYRAESFIHEITHVKHSALPGFRAAWNALIGVPLMVPSFMYEGVHNLHHAKTRYGTAEDPEYLPLALMRPWTLPAFILVAALAPIGLILRYAVLAPLSLLSPKLREAVVARYSGLVINPVFRRRPPEGEAKALWTRLEIVTSLWAVTFVALAVTGVLPLRAVLIILGIASAVAVLNQVRTLVAHLWENEGEAMTVTAQYLDSVNVPPPALLPGLWAPVGLRYHALHHLLPSVPYHNLGSAHRRLAAMLDPSSPYFKANYKGLPGLMWKIGLSSVTRGGRGLPG
ncbi:fatty acid desaturase [Sphingomonas sp. ID1715]|uniref:fatty acid desaturase family protein n=1 Tax=Sphingomonas sp. ID1715 TaxID=1656898 RepID=UPI0014894D3B|nr:fatty acid desaturase [Sphingomonas sp. ID1715]NNM78304.1 fatty acid desaturase [Sphingomonas sp. ID1715]